jgi:uncharacterized protein with HEPN domain
MKSSTNFIQHIVDETSYLLETSKALSKEDFSNDATKQRAFVRSLEIIGEAVKNLPEDFKQAYPDIEWRKMAATRDRLIHGYFSIDLDIIWDIIENKIPALHNSISGILENIEDIQAIKSREDEPSIPFDEVIKQQKDE